MDQILPPLLMWLAGALVVALIAKAWKGRDPAGWFFIGLLGPLTLLVLAFLPSKKAPSGPQVRA